MNNEVQGGTKKEKILAKSKPTSDEVVLKMSDDRPTGQRARQRRDEARIRSERTTLLHSAGMSQEWADSEAGLCRAASQADTSPVRKGGASTLGVSLFLFRIFMKWQMDKDKL